MHDVLAIFPSRGLDNSILIPIFIGLMFHGFFIESFGWSFAGLVVPGYLASVFAIAPQAGLIIVLEILTTYLIVYIISEVFARFGWWHSFFGRDRFLAFFVASLIVRLIYEVWFFQLIAESVVSMFDLPLESTQHLYGIGLVIVPLTSHAMWRTGLRRGLIQVFVPAALTYLVLTQILIPYTNFSIANFELTFQDLALDFSSSPKIYITLILGMLIAARLNLRLGWDFNGIMVPSLLAIAWYTPWKILTTIVESTLVVFVAWLIASLPIFRRSNLEGTRRLLLIFTVGLVLKYLIGTYFESTTPGFKVSDLFGFGYLLPSLIALNIWEHRSWSLVIGPTLVTSFSAFVAGNIIGLGLYQVDKLFVGEIVLAETDHQVSAEIPFSSADSLLLAGVSTLPMVPEEFVQTNPANRLRFQRIVGAVNQLARGSHPGDEPRWITREFANDLKRLHLELTWAEQPGSKSRLLVLREPLDSPLTAIQGWGTLALVSGCQGGVMLEVPFPAEEPESLDTALVLQRQLNACALYSNGWRTFQPGETAVLRRSGSPFAIVHELLSNQPIIQIRTWNKQTTIFVQDRVPPYFNLETFKQQFPDYRLSWRAYDEERPGVDLGYAEQIEIVLNRNDLRKLWKPLDVPQSVQSGLATMRSMMVDKTALISPANSEKYRPATPLEMEFLTDRIVRPLLLVLSQEHADTPEGRNELSEQLGLLQARAQFLGFSLQASTHGPYQIEVLMHEPALSRGWGFYLFRSGANRWAIQVTRPLLESGTLEMALDAYGRFDASVLMIAGADLDTREDGLADITRLDNPVNPFQAIHRGLYPIHPSSPEPWILQIRGAAAARTDLRGAVVSTGEELGPHSPREPMLATLLNDLDNQKIVWELFDGTEQQIGLKAVDNLQIRYASSLIPQSAALLWINHPDRVNEPALDTIQRQISTLIDRYQIPVNQAAIENLPISALSEPLPVVMSKALTYCQRYTETGDPGYWIAASKLASGERGFAQTLMQDTISGKYFAFLLNGASSQWCLIRMDTPGEHRTIGEGEDGKMDLLRMLRYGETGSVCNAEVAP